MMRKSRYFLVTTLAVLGWALFVWQITASAKQKPGMDPYIPPKMEWLVMDFNATHRSDHLLLAGYNISFIEDADYGTVVIMAQYDSTVNRMLMGIEVNLAKGAIERFARMKGWESWVKIKVEYSKVG